MGWAAILVDVLLGRAVCVVDYGLELSLSDDVSSE
jgi:hypothetical protein